MKVFLSWSGAYSRQVAEALRDWLPLVLNEVKPFISTGIEAGARWQTEIATQLAETHFGIIVVTADNQSKPWLNFEAGALAKSVSASRVIPLAVDLGVADITQPLGQFQAQKLGIEGVLNVVKALNSGLTSPLEDGHVERALRACWPTLETELDRAESANRVQPGAAASQQRPDREVLDEILTIIRQLDRTRQREFGEDDSAQRQLAELVIAEAARLGEQTPQMVWSSEKVSIVCMQNSHDMSIELREFAWDAARNLQIVIVPYDDFMKYAVRPLLSSR